MPNATGIARGWILNLPAGTWFSVPAVPAPKRVVNNLLSRMLAEERPVIGRAARGLYWRQHPPATGRHGRPPRRDVACLSVACPQGSGYADWDALFALGWSTQMPARTIIATPHRNLKPPTMRLPGEQWTYLHRPNQRRRDLNWNEATLLEGASAFAAASHGTWEEKIGRLINGECPGLKPYTMISMRKVERVAETEKALHRWPAGEDDLGVRHVIGRLVADLPEVVLVP